jgi:hypothetical protein
VFVFFFYSGGIALNNIDEKDPNKIIQVDKSGAHFWRVAKAMKFDSGEMARHCSKCNLWHRSTTPFLEGTQATSFMLEGECQEVIEDCPSVSKILFLTFLRFFTENLNIMMEK